MDSSNTDTPSWLDKPLSTYIPKVTFETLLISILLILAVFSRFYNVDLRVMSHDEVNHVVPGYSLYRGTGYAYDPVTHGPLQFHLLALSYFVLGDSDFSSRVPAVLFSIATIVVVVFGFRRYLGRTGALIAGFLFLISPFMLFYGRYTRNEVFGGLWTVLVLLGTLRYLEKGERGVLYMLTVVTALHFSDKATAFIYNAQLLLFLGLLFLERLTRVRWPSEKSRKQFILFTGLAVLLLLVALGLGVANAKPAVETAVTAAESSLKLTGELIALAGVLVFGALAVVGLVRNLGWKTIRAQRSFDLIVLIGTLTMPQLTAFPVRMLGWDPLDYTTGGMTRTALVLVPLFIISILVGLWWKPRFWLSAAAIFYAIFTVFFTTFFTNGKGFFMGLVASLGYWLSQQGVERGSQPLYYYLLLQIPVYEYLAAIGTLAALAVGVRKRLLTQWAGFAPARQPVIDETEEAQPAAEAELPATGAVEGEDSGEPVEALEPAHALMGGEPFSQTVRHMLEREEEAPAEAEKPQRVPVLALLLYWSLTSLAAYSLAGEKMPWLTLHIAVAMLLATGWVLGYLVDTTPWKKIASQRGLLAVLTLPVMLASLGGTLGGLLGNQPPFQGNTLDQLQASSTFMMSMLGLVGSGAAFIYLTRGWHSKALYRMLVLAFFTLLAMLTTRHTIMASYINYDNPTEYLVYAHAASGPKEVLAQIEEISRRLTRGKEIVIAYDNEINYPYWHYLRDYPNRKFFADKPTRDIGEAPLIAVGGPNYSKVEPIVKENYIMFEYNRMWWPNQDYIGLTGERLAYALLTPQMRTAIFNIWMNRDYRLYAEITNNPNLTLENWQPAERFRFYVRKDIAAMIWNYGVQPASVTPGQVDPYEQGLLRVAPDKLFGQSGNQPGQFNAPRGIAVAADGTLYVADSRNHRVQHVTSEGKVLHMWGSFADVLKGAAPEGTFNEPWGVAVSPVDGTIFVADTFNFRIQHFTADGKFINMWGFAGQAEKPDAFWGPRGIVVDKTGKVYVTDTGNKRVAVFNSDGTPVASFGSLGMENGQFDEPVGLALDADNNVYVADTWNQRVQVFTGDASGIAYLAVRTWDVKAWFGQSIDNKPFLAVTSGGTVMITDPEAGRVLEFYPDGSFVRGWSDLLGDPLGMGMPTGIAISNEGVMWISDASNGRLMAFNLALQPVISGGGVLIGPQVASPTPTQGTLK